MKKILTLLIIICTVTLLDAQTIQIDGKVYNELIIEKKYLNDSLTILNDSLKYYKTITNNYVTLKDRYNQLQNNHKTLQLEKDSLQKSIEINSHSKEGILSLQTQIDEKSNEITDLKSKNSLQTKRLDSLNELLKSKTDLHEKLKNLKSELETTTVALQNQKNLNNDNVGTITALKDSLKNQEELINKLLMKQTNLENQYDELEKEKADLTNKLNKKFPILVESIKKEIKGKIKSINETNIFNDSIIANLKKINIDFLEEDDKEFNIYQQLHHDFNVYEQSIELLNNDYDKIMTDKVLFKMKKIDTKNQQFKTKLDYNIRLLENYCGTIKVAEIWFKRSGILNFNEAKFVNPKIGNLKKQIVEKRGNYPYINELLNNYKPKDKKNPFTKTPPLNCTK